MSIKHNPGSSPVLRKLVDAWHAALSEPLWNSEDPFLRSVGEYTVMSTEPRMWKWPRHIFRDRVVLPAIEERDGQEACEAFRKAPHLLDDYADKWAESLWRQAPASARGAPRQDTTKVVETFVLALFFHRYEKNKSWNGNCCRVAEVLKIQRGAVWRIVRARSCALRDQSFLLVLPSVVEFIEGVHPQASVRKQTTVSPLPPNKRLSHAAGPDGGNNERA